MTLSGHKIDTLLCDWLQHPAYCYLTLHFQLSRQVYNSDASQPRPLGLGCSLSIMSYFIPSYPSLFCDILLYSISFYKEKIYHAKILPKIPCMQFRIYRLIFKFLCYPWIGKLTSLADHTSLWTGLAVLPTDLMDLNHKSRQFQYSFGAVFKIAGFLATIYFDPRL